jgi:hypothetical protein
VTKLIKKKSFERRRAKSIANFFHAIFSAIDGSTTTASYVALPWVSRLLTIAILFAQVTDYALLKLWQTGSGRSQLAFARLMRLKAQR